MFRWTCGHSVLYELFLAAFCFLLPGFCCFLSQHPASTNSELFLHFCWADPVAAPFCGRFLPPSLRGGAVLCLVSSCYNSLLFLSSFEDPCVVYQPDTGGFHCSSACMIWFYKVRKNNKKSQVGIRMHGQAAKQTQHLVLHKSCGPEQRERDMDLS